MSQIEPNEVQGPEHITIGFNTLSKCRHGWMLYHTAYQFIGRGLRKYGEFSEGIDSLNLNRCRLIKVDVEGMECEVLEGARNTITRLRPVLYVENDRTEHSRRLITMIQSFGYKLWWHLPRMFNPDNFRGNKENLFGNIVSVNMLCSPQETQTLVDLPEIKTPEDDWRKVGKM
jgi:hypothetical protein